MFNVSGSQSTSTGRARWYKTTSAVAAKVIVGRARRLEKDEQVDAEHWIAAYSELISYKEALLITSAHQRAYMENPSAQAEAGGVDVVILKRELENFRRRLAFWLLRLDEIKAG